MTHRSALGSLSPLIATAGRDLGFALRGLRRSPGLTLTIVLSLSLGVGANVAVFTALDRVFLQAPPGVAHPDQMRRLYARIFYTRGPDYGATGRVMPNLSTHDLEELSEATRGVARLAGNYLGYGWQLNGNGPRVRTTLRQRSSCLPPRRCLPASCLPGARAV